MLLGQVALVFGLEVFAEVDVVVEPVFDRAQYIHRLPVGESYEIR